MFKIAVFWEEAFPTADFVPMTLPGLREALEGFDVHILSAEDFAQLPEYDLLILPFGSAFPKEAWPQLMVYLEAGGNLLNLGGAPFSIPCVRKHIAWNQEIRQTAYHKELRINQAFPVDGARIASLEVPEELPLLGGMDLPQSAGRVFELTVRFTDVRDHPGEGGSSGPRDAVVRPLLFGKDASGQRIAAPVLAIDRLHGSFAGGRWVFANTDASLSQEMIRRLAFFAACGATDFTVNPSFACYREGEQPRFTLYAGRFGTLRGRHSARLTVTGPDGNQSTCELPAITVGDLPAYRWVDCGAGLLQGKKLTPGLYTVEATLINEDARALAESLHIASVAQPGMRRHRNGFWIWDEDLMRGGKSFTLERDYFRRDGEPYPVMGTTYMGSDVHRKFLFEPNPALWDQDFQAMKAAGVNMIRTGIWTAWRRVMLDPGAPDEGALRALDAFLLTARKYELPVIFTFFAFLPEMWEGSNPYLDPRSREAQKEFLAAFIERYPHVPDLMWDLINEPSFCSPRHVWSTRPNYDRYEQQAWRKWIAGRDEKELQEEWRLTPRQALDLPALEDFQDRFIFQGTHPIRSLDYRLFAQEMFNNWVTEMSNFIRLVNPTPQPITVGQDEGGLYERPNPQFHADRVDFTCNHSWWKNNDLLWDSILAKTLHKPNLIEETGIMFVENVDGSYRRTEEEARNLLERKLAFAIGGNAAGAIQWLWNTNVVMDSDNEVAIGFLRGDHTAKPELAPFTAMADFLQRNRMRMEGREPEPTVMLIPHSNMFSVRNLASAATQACVRTFHYANAMPLRAVGEYNLEDLGEPQLILLPSPRVLRQEAWDALIGRVEKGATLLVTGPVDYDPYWRRRERLAAFGLRTSTRAVVREEIIRLDGQQQRLSFGGEKIHQVDKAVVEGQPATVTTIAHGAGKLIFAPLPFELADNNEPLARLYDLAIRESGLERPFTLEERDPGVLVRPIFYRDAVLYTLISETDETRTVTIRHGAGKTPLAVTAPAQRAVLLFVDRDSGRVLDQYAPPE